MIPGELSHLAGKMHAAIGQQNLGFADAAGIKDDLAGRGIAGVVLVGDAEVEVAERHPDPLAAPAHMDRLALERHRLAECRAGPGRELFLETGVKCEVAGADNELAHSGILVMADEGRRNRLQPRIPEARNIPVPWPNSATPWQRSAKADRRARG
jgi:hypothetical protein